jgi:hypothetical protein
MKRRYRILTGKATSKILAEQAAGLAALQSWDSVQNFSHFGLGG